MANISQEKDLEMLKKNADGTFTKYNPHTKASNVITSAGKTVESQLADMAKRTEVKNAQSTADSAVKRADEAFQLGDSTKKEVVSILSSKGVTGLTTSSTWKQIENAMQTMSLGKKWASGNFISPMSSPATHTVNNLDFKPSIVIVYMRTTRSSWDSFVFLTSYYAQSSVRTIIGLAFNPSLINIDDVDTRYHINEDGFTVICGQTYELHNWIAVE